jgi:hypothetical protein
MSQQRPRGSRPSLPSASNGTLGAAVAVVALLLGFLILRDVRADGGSSVTPATKAPEVTVPGGGTIDPNSSSSTAPFNIMGFKIQVANASGIAGSAGDMTGRLQARGYVVPEAKNVAPGTAKRLKTGVYYTVGCEANAQNVAAVLGGNVDLGPMPNPVPLEDGSIGEACVLILLGTDLSNKPLAGAEGGPNGSAATTTVPQ